jgi:hypothetical protein
MTTFSSRIVAESTITPARTGLLPSSVGRVAGSDTGPITGRFFMMSSTPWIGTNRSSTICSG